MRRSLVLSLASGMLLVAAATAPAVAQDTLKIGAPQPMTGPDAPFGDKFSTEVPGAMPKTAAAVYDNTVFGKTIANSALTFLKSKNVPIVNDEAYPVNSLDFKPVMTKVKASNPDFLLMVAVATTDAILLTKHAKEIGVAPRAFAGLRRRLGLEYPAKSLGPQSQNVFS